MRNILILIVLNFIAIHLTSQNKNNLSNKRSVNSDEEIFKLATELGGRDIFFSDSKSTSIIPKFIWLRYVSLQEVKNEIISSIVVTETFAFEKELLKVKTNENLINLIKKYPKGSSIVVSESWNRENFYSQLRSGEIRVYYSPQNKITSVIANKTENIKRLPIGSIGIASKDFCTPSNY